MRAEPVSHPSPMAGLTQTRMGSSAGQGGTNRTRKINADDKPVGNLTGENETAATEEKPPQQGFIGVFPGNVLNWE